MNSHVEETDILIIGAGWAGLSTAITLIDQGKQVCLVESAKAPGGRARKVNYCQYAVDNGTHIMVGAYTQALALMKKVHSKNTWKENTLLERQSLNLHCKQNKKKSFELPKVPLPAPFNIIFSFLLAKGLKLKDKIRILNFGLKIKFNLISIESDLNLESFLIKQNQNPNIIKNIWEPLCIAIMNTPIAQTSTEIFLLVLKDSFFKNRSASDLLFFKTNLSDAFPTPAQHYIEQHNGKICFNRRAVAIIKDDDHYLVKTKSTTFKAKHVVVATAPTAAVNLLQNLNESSAHNELIGNLQTFTYQPICTIYLQYPELVASDRTMQGFLGTTIQWMFDKSSANQPNLISVIISSQGSHLEMDNPTLINTITNELAQFYPQWPQPNDAFVIREKRATFTASVNINRIRPSNKTDTRNIWLAGDYTNTQYPATLEGAVRSGLQCAKQILSEF